MQMSGSYIVPDPKGTLILETGKMFQKGVKVKDKDGDIPVRLLNSQYGLTMYLTNVGTVYEKPNGRVDYEESENSEENTKVFCIVYC